MNSKFFFILSLLLSPFFWAEGDFSLGSNRLFLHDFKVNGVFTLKEKKNAVPAPEAPSAWTITGERAAVQGDHYQLSGFEMQITNPRRGTVHLLSPHCDFFRTANEIKSNAALLLHADGLQISGLGYDVYQQDDNMMLVIRSTVQIHFLKDRIKKLSRDGKS